MDYLPAENLGEFKEDNEDQIYIHLPAEAARGLVTSKSDRKNIANLERYSVIENVSHNVSKKIATEKTKFTEVGARTMLTALNHHTREYMDIHSASNRLTMCVILSAIQDRHFIATVRIPYYYYYVPIDRVVYVKSPHDVDVPERIWRLKKTIPGLPFAKELWQEYLSDLMASEGFKKINSGCFKRKNVTMLKCNNELLISGTRSGVQRAVKDINRVFGERSVNTCMYFNGYRLETFEDGVSISAPTRSLLGASLKGKKSKVIRGPRITSPIDKSEVEFAFDIRSGKASSEPLKSVGSFYIQITRLRCLSRKLRKDILHAVCLLDLVLSDFSVLDGDCYDEFEFDDSRGIERYRIKPTKHHLKMLERIVNYTRQTRERSFELKNTSDSTLHPEFEIHTDWYGEYQITRYEEYIYYGESMLALFIKLERGGGTENYMVRNFNNFSKQCSDTLEIAKKSIDDDNWLVSAAKELSLNEPVPNERKKSKSSSTSQNEKGKTQSPPNKKTANPPTDKNKTKKSNKNNIPKTGNNKANTKNSKKAESKNNQDTKKTKKPLSSDKKSQRKKDTSQKSTIE